MRNVSPRLSMGMGLQGLFAKMSVVSNCKHNHFVWYILLYSVEQRSKTWLISNLGVSVMATCGSRSQTEETACD